MTRRGDDTTPLRIYAFECGGDRWGRAFYDPLDAQFDAVVYAPNFFFLITHPLGNVLFDTGMHPRWQDDPHLPDALGPHVRPGDDAPAQLHRIGLSPADVSWVIVSHLHYDHAGGLLYFPHAKVIVQERELEFALDPPPYQADLFDRRDFDHDVDWLPIEDEHDVFDDGRIVVLPTPGHTPGHQSAAIALPSRAHVLAGDAHYLAGKMRLRRLPAVTWHADAMLESWLKLEALEQEEGAVLVFTHDFESPKPVPPQYYG